MGFLSVNGFLMTYDEYKQWQERYKHHGLMQFVKLYSVHKDRQIKQEDLHWGEEIEYQMFNIDPDTRQVKLACDASHLIQSFNNMNKEEKHFDFALLPEFGNWMIEAVPSEPYKTYSDPDHLLSCTLKLKQR